MVVKKKEAGKRPVHGKCPECGRTLDKNSRFCKHCGAKLLPLKKIRTHKCPNCSGIVEEFSRFCKHCGANIDTLIHSKFVRFLLYFILVIVLALLVFFAPTFVDFEEMINDGDGEELIHEISDPFLKLNTAVCTWEGDSYNVCANVNWKGKKEGDFVRCSFSGETDENKWMSSPFTCCGDVGEEEGVKLVRAFLINDKGVNYLDDSLSVSCSGKPVVKPVVPGDKYSTYQKNFWFIARTRGGASSDGKGVEYIEFPGKVRNCEINGKWITRKENNRFSGEGACDDAEGIFFGEADLYGQSVFSDPSNFWWAGFEAPMFDPEGAAHEGYGVYLDLCDTSYLTGPRNYVRGRFSGFGTKEIALDWEYYSRYPKPEVDIIIDLKCQVY